MKVVAFWQKVLEPGGVRPDIYLQSIAYVPR